MKMLNGIDEVQSQISELIAQLQREKRTYRIDFMLGAGAPNNGVFSGSALAGGTLGTVTATSAKHPGNSAFRSAESTANSGYRVNTVYSALMLGGGESGRFVLNTFSNFNTHVAALLGFHNSTDHNNPTDGVYFKISNGVIKGCTAKNSAISETGTSYELAASTWYQLCIDLNESASAATFRIYDDNGVLMRSDTLSTNIPTAATGFGVNVWTTTSVAAQTLLIMDCMEFTPANARGIIQ